jgi:hypothetical protein
MPPKTVPLVCNTNEKYSAEVQFTAVLENKRIMYRQELALYF